ncbi:phenylacetic acid degradation bifunctional protein PaaZ [Euzebya tangerina]|uniref:phenylacetic acid degradation bifunctional protein PaaZ n=1 Tax=Euzebya tangerina TaxID=591198 RepID=UPI00196B0C4C|nr:phenylacetic acid degradation bifunctional protein PaaZ [Euzebya tangerina]
MLTLQSYVEGRWVTGDGEQTLMRDAATGTPVAVASSDGLDFGSILDHGRTVGGAALRAMTVHERAVAVKLMAQDLMARREDFAELSWSTGATTADRQYDVEGGFLTARALSSAARQALPNGHVIHDGPPVQLSRDGSFVGQHVYTPRQGVVVQINAYNFPVWGMLEKLAPALIAGMPSVVKPAPQTAQLTEAVVRRIIKAGHLPDGAIQLVVGEPGDLLDHVTSQDVVAFTGSAATARTLKAHPSLLASGATFNAEQDSLNCAILGPDAGPGTPEFELFCAEVVGEITAKAGQRCTCIRRVIVPDALGDAVAEALLDRLGDTVVGDPRDQTTTVGPLVTTAQRQAVLEAVEALSTHAEVLTGDPESPSLQGDVDQAGFLAPTVLRAADPWAEPLHTVEAFGPVTTIIGYEDVDEAVALAAAGDGSLVGSLFTTDRSVAAAVVGGAAAHHGRIHMVDASVAKSQSGHGTPMPTMVHGGPGRAGGGEELGGVRGIFHFMQRTALQGPPALITAATGTWLPGAEARSPEVHPMAMDLESVQIGDQVTIGPREVTLADIEAFAHSTGDHFYAHMDADAVADHPFFEGRVAHGYLLLSWAAGMFVHAPKGPLLANQGLNDLHFGVPFYPGDEMTVTLTCKQKSPRTDQPYGEVRWDTRISNQRGEECASYELLTVVAKPTGAGS